MAKNNGEVLSLDTTDGMTVARLKAVFESHPEYRKWYDPDYVLELCEEHIARLVGDAGDSATLRETMAFISQARDARKNNEVDIAQSTFLLLGLYLARVGLSQASSRKPGEPETLEHFMRNYRALVLADANRTKPATDGKTAKSLLVQQHIEGIDRALGLRDKKQTKKRRISAIRTRILATPADKRPTYLKKPPSVWTIRQYVK